MTIYTEFAALMADVILETGIQVTYKPNGGTPRTIQAHVEYPPPDRYAETPAPVSEIWVLNDATNGISEAELDRGSDLINFPQRVGDSTSKDRVISDIINQYPSHIQLEVR